MELLWLVPALPVFGFLILSTVGARLSKRSVAFAGVSPVALSTVFALLATIDFVRLLPPIAGGPLSLAGLPANLAYSQTLWTWIEADGFASGLGLRLDGLSLAMILVVTSVSLLILLYSVSFMSEDDGYSRFFAYMNLFVGSMLLLVLADNLLLLYLGWEAVGLCSYLLIGFWYRDPANGKAAIKAFIVTRVGDTSFAIGLFVLFFGLGTLDIREIGVKAVQSWPVGSSLAILAAALLLGGAVGKSAQLPLQTWLPDAMAGPTPVSALIHAATMVTAGVYLIARMNVIFGLAPVVQAIVAVIGVLTLLTAAWSALFQRDIKRVLAYSTMSQVGYMFLALGVGAWSAAIFHFMTHAFFKALLFLSAGVVIQALANEHDIFEMGGLRKRLPVAFWTFLIGAASLSAFPFVTAGFYSKEMILADVWDSPLGGPLLWLSGTIGAFITALYAFRVVFVVFFGKETNRPRTGQSGLMSWPLAVLAIFALGAGFFEFPGTFGLGSLLGPVMGALPPSLPLIAQTKTDALLMVITSFVSLAGIACAYLLYHGRKVSDAAFDRKSLAQASVRFWSAGWGFDWLYRALFVRPYVTLARVSRGDVIDRIYDGFASTTAFLARALAAAQSGLVRWYAMALAAGAAIFLAIMVFR